MKSAKSNGFSRVKPGVPDWRRPASHFESRVQKVVRNVSYVKSNAYDKIRAQILSFGNNVNYTGFAAGRKGQRAVWKSLLPKDFRSWTGSVEGPPMRRGPKAGLRNSVSFGRNDKREDNIHERSRNNEEEERHQRIEDTHESRIQI